MIDTSEEERPHIWMAEILEDGEWVTTKKPITTVAISNDLLRMQPGRADTFVLNSMMRGMRTKLDCGAEEED